jgi:gag-polypeptide of LTR copia-type
VKLEERYASQSMNSKHSLVTELQNKKFTRKGNMSDHVEEFETQFAKLEKAGHEIEPLMQVSIFLASLEGHSEYNAKIAAVITLDDNDIKCDIVTTRLRDEYKNKQKQYGSMHGPLTGSTVAYVNHSQKKKPTCKSCGKMGHNESKCWYNPESPEYRGNRSNNTSGSSNKRAGVKWQPKKKGPTAACVTGALAHDLVHDDNGFILDSCASHHVCSKIEFMTNLRNCTHAVSLGDNSKITIKQMGQIELFLHRPGNANAWLLLDNAMYTKECMNIISVSKFDKHNITTIFGK